MNFQLSDITDVLNNITMSEIASVLHRLPLPHILSFDGFPLFYNDVSYYLYTRKNPKNRILLKRSFLTSSAIDPDHKVKFIIHGWLENADRPYMRALKNSYIARGEYNVITVDWARPSQVDYAIASMNTKSVGRDLGEFIIRIMKILNIPLKHIHIIGHSLGAHVAGFAGKEVRKRIKRKVGRITALDAAGPLFEIPIPVDESMRLSKNDAEFVDCIHTDGGIFGMTQAIGHVDFYPNGGVPRQPGCSNINIRNLSTRVIIDDSKFITIKLVVYLDFMVYFMFIIFYVCLTIINVILNLVYAHNIH